MNNKYIFSFGAKVAVGIALVAVVFGAGLYVGNDQGLHKAAAAEKVDLSQFWKVWDLIGEKWVPTASSTYVTDEQKVDGAIKGLVESLGDPYTIYLPPSELKNFNEQISGNFEGIGMEVDLKDNVLTVVSPIKGTPSYNAGIKTGDKILAIGATTTKDMSVDNAVNLIRGKAGTVVSLTVLHEGDAKPVEIKVTRAVINVPAVETETKNGVFIIHLSEFSALSEGQFKSALRDFVATKSNKLVIDLRDNPGGYLESAVDIASWFLPAGEVVVSEDYGSAKAPDVYKSKGYNVFGNDLKIAVLINGGSASASEILAGALSENNRATLVGEQSFGKGSVQELVPVTANSSVKVTIARWLTPKGNSISLKGITPDYVVPMTVDDVKAGKDPQMDKALNLLNK